MIPRAFSLTILGFLGGKGVGQNVPVKPPILVTPIQQPAAGEDLGATVHLIESATLDRFLDKARDFLGRGDYASAIKVLQDVLEGRVAHDPDAAEPGPGERAETERFVEEDDASKAVFSGDSRLFRPVRRLCQEMLASLPDVGIALYQAKYEVEAAQAFEAALATRDLRGLERVYARYFVTLSSGRAMDAAGDLLMDAGRFRSAVHAFRTLLELYPARCRAEAGVSDVAVELKMAVCHRQMGEGTRVAEVLGRMGQRYPGEAVRLLGETVPVAELRESEVFAGGLHEPRQAALPAARLSRADLEGLIPLWEFRFEEAQPYRGVREARRNNRVFQVVRGGSGALTVPLPGAGEPGNSATFVDGLLAFMDHNRLRVHELATGLMLGEGDGSVDQPRLQQGQPQPRVAAYDFATMAVAYDEERFYTVQAPDRLSVLNNELVAYGQADLERLWSSDDHKGAADGYRGLTFLAAPTVHESRLLVPVLHRDTYALQCIESATGRPVFRTYLHSGGTELARAPGCPVGVENDTAYVLTNAGVLASVDAHSGAINWLRRYERLHPFREHRANRAVPGTNRLVGMTQYLATKTLEGFLPSALYLDDGRVLFAPCDGRVLLCLDAASGEPEWLLTMPSLGATLVGRNSRHLFVAGSRITCIDLHSGVRLWDAPLPDPASGRGLVTEDLVIMPGDRHLNLLAADGTGMWRSVPLPLFLKGREPLTGKSNLYLNGPYVVAVYSGGLEVYGSVSALEELALSAADPLQQASYLVQAGNLTDAIDVLGRYLESDAVPAAQRQVVTRRALALCREVASAMSVLQRRPEALALLDRCRRWLQERELIARWHLARLQVFRNLRDVQAVERESDELERLMRGKNP